VAKSVARTGAAALSLSASGIVTAYQGKATTGATSIGFNLTTSVVKRGTPYGVAALTFASSAAIVKSGQTGATLPLTFVTVGVPSKARSVAGASTLLFDADAIAAKAANVASAVALVLAGAGAAEVGDGTYRPDPGRTLTVGDHDRVLRVQPRRRTIHVGPADRRFTWH